MSSTMTRTETTTSGRPDAGDIDSDIEDGDEYEVEFTVRTRN